MGWVAAPRRGEVDHELIWGPILLAALVAARLLEFWPAPWRAAGRCPFHAMTGHPCALCGGTRAWEALTAGEIGAAWGLNPLATLAGIAVAGYVTYAAGAIVARRRWRPGWLGRPAVMRALAACLLVAAAVNWIWLLARGF